MTDMQRLQKVIKLNEIRIKTDQLSKFFFHSLLMMQNVPLFSVYFHFAHRFSYENMLKDVNSWCFK